MPKPITAERHAFNLYIGNRLAELRMAAGLSQADVAEALDMTTAGVSKFEHGKAGINLYDLVRVSWLLHLPAADLLGYYVYRTPETPASQ